MGHTLSVEEDEIPPEIREKQELLVYYLGLRLRCPWCRPLFPKYILEIIEELEKYYQDKLNHSNWENIKILLKIERRGKYRKII